MILGERFLAVLGNAKHAAFLPGTGVSDTLMIVGGSLLVVLAAAFAYMFRGR